MAELENSIENRAVDLIWELLGIKGSKLRVIGDTGFPDRIFWCPGGRPFLVEFKRPGEEPRPKQAQVHKSLRKLGYHVEVHDDAITAVEALITFLEASRLPKAQHQVLDRARRHLSALKRRRSQ